MSRSAEEAPFLTIEPGTRRTRLVFRDDPTHPDHRDRAIDALSEIARDPERVPGPRPLQWWVDGAGAGPGEVAAAAGWHLVRTLHELRCPLPLPDPLPPPGFAVRSFRRPDDAAAWLRINNAAFAWHPDQSAWTRRDLDELLDQSWVDTDDIVIHDGPEGPDAFCWVRHHPGAEGTPRLGEIFIIAVHPSAQGTGTGRAILLAGLDRLARSGETTGMLWCEADNAPALDLYRSLGFRPHSTRSAWEPDPLRTSTARGADPS